MANIAAADVGYGRVDAVISAPGRVRSRWALVIPATANVTYPTGGVPINAALMVGLRGIMAVCKVVAQNLIAGATNEVWMWNGSTTAPKLVAYVQGGAAGGAQLQEYAGSLTQGALALTVEVENG